MHSDVRVWEGAKAAPGGALLAKLPVQLLSCRYSVPPGGKGGLGHYRGCLCFCGCVLAGSCVGAGQG